MSILDTYDHQDATGLAKLVRDKEVHPVELVEAAIARIEELNPKLNAVVHKNYGRALEYAKAPLELEDAPFAGVPFLLKDLKAEDKGEPSTSSCALTQNHIATQDCALVGRFKQSGLIILGRTNTPEFGVYGVTEPALRGPTKNPWNTEHTPGGSSGGSAAAVASRMVPMAHAGDGGGSIRIPAAHCGLFGLKPTRARNSLAPFVSEGWGGLVSEHVITRSVRDSARMLDATCGPQLGDPYQVRPPTRPFIDEIGAPTGKLRIAFTTKALFGDSMHQDCKDAVEDAANLAKHLGHEVEEACPEFDKDTLVRCYLLMVSAGVAHSVKDAGKKAGRAPRASDFEPTTWLLKLIADHISSSAYVSAQMDINLATRSMAKFFERYDVLLLPTAAKPPVRIGEFAITSRERTLLSLLRKAPMRSLLMKALEELPKGPLSATPNTMLFNLTGQPAMSIPLSWNAQGLPIGVQWVGRFGDEATLFRLASQIEQERPWAQKIPLPK